MVSRETYQDDYPVPEGYDLNVQAGDSVPAGDVLAAREDLEPVTSRVTGVIDAVGDTVTISYEEIEEREYEVAPPRASR